jgi:hypothetical protein
MGPLKNDHTNSIAYVVRRFNNEYWRVDNTAREEKVGGYKSMSPSV